MINILQQPDATVRSIPFNKPFSSGKEIELISEVIASGKTSGNGKYTKACQTFLENKYSFRKCLLTSSCTDALEMAAILLSIGPGDEIIIPSYTFVSTANAFILRGAKIVFADSGSDNPNIDTSQLEKLITPKTKCVVIVHYGGVACDMEALMAIIKKHSLFLVEDAAQAIDNYYTDRAGKKLLLGSFGHMSAFSFHETKNISCGEGGVLVINDESLIARAEIIWEKGTNRSAFFRGEVDKYGWVDVGSSFLMSDVTAAYLYAQLQEIESVQSKRLKIWNAYFEGLTEIAEECGFVVQSIPSYSANNAHLFYIICKTLGERSQLISFLKNAGIQSVFHYQSLHNSQFYKLHNSGTILNNADMYTDRLLRLPLFADLNDDDVRSVIENIRKFYRSCNAYN